MSDLSEEESFQEDLDGKAILCGVAWLDKGKEFDESGFFTDGGKIFFLLFLVAWFGGGGMGLS